MPKVKKEAGSRNRELARGVLAYSKSAMNKVAGRARFRTKGGARAAPKGAPVKKNASKWYPADDEPFPLMRTFTPKTARLRSSITPGTVLIVLSGRFRGKRVVFLKQLPSGLLLVTGPYKVNGVPLRRLNQAYVIATKTTVDVSGVSIPETVNDKFFKASEAAKPAKGGEEEFFASGVKPVEIPAERKEIQKSVDKAILSGLDDMTKRYLNAKFTLTKGQFPHEMTF
mmetsp:Transcript_39470/g.72813  ORF Transcript_39470/g.72813 Transcript_39470/m.72813 type:complete len:227 (-) Transcript_39470:274-954(-)|eukprot:CAMPEP_0197450736 /NCGR_PEP_ID=MMETSP1175-20131217/26353_1 /TAXON_ID=1003142 /ORGANISM="Triceratium dubium, Strain CCMP147" /LENGTH=226 /DNA_ID=CAMNT_0042983223 /DNA_START=26 /DNA_END=706 /DNA_ORIENTATION=-